MFFIIRLVNFYVKKKCKVTISIWGNSVSYLYNNRVIL